MTVTPISTDTEFLAFVAGVYRDVVATADPNEGTTKAEARAEAVTRLRDMVEGGDLQIPLDFALLTAVDQADRSDGKAADRVLACVINGQSDLGIEGSWLDTVVVLGDGRRKALRHIRDVDLRDMDTNRWRNLRNAQDAYAKWRDIYNPALDAVAVHGDIGTAVEHGAFTIEAVA